MNICYTSHVFMISIHISMEKQKKKNVSMHEYIR